MEEPAPCGGVLDDPGWASLMSIAAVEFSGPTPRLVAAPEHIQESLRL